MNLNTILCFHIHWQLTIICYRQNMVLQFIFNTYLSHPMYNNTLYSRLMLLKRNMTLCFFVLSSERYTAQEQIYLTHTLNATELTSMGLRKQCLYTFPSPRDNGSQLLLLKAIAVIYWRAALKYQRLHRVLCRRQKDRLWRNNDKSLYFYNIRFLDGYSVHHLKRDLIQSDIAFTETCQKEQLFENMNNPAKYFYSIISITIVTQIRID